MVNSGKANHVGRERAMWVDAPLFIDEPKTGNAETIDGVLLARTEVALDPNKTTIRR